MAALSPVAAATTTTGSGGTKAATGTPVTPAVATTASFIQKNDDDFKKQLKKVEAKMKKINKIAEQLEKEKYMIRRALLSGKFDEINREKALVYAKQWDRGIQFIPLNPSDWVGLSENQEEEEDTKTNDNGIFKKVDEAMTARRQWIKARPPSLYPEFFSEGNVPLKYQVGYASRSGSLNYQSSSLNYQSQVPGSMSTPWLPIQQQNPLEQRTIADWRVMPVQEDQPIYSLNL